MRLSVKDRISMFNSSSTKKEDNKAINKIPNKVGQNKKEGNNEKNIIKVPDNTAKKVDNKIVDEKNQLQKKIKIR